MIAFNKKYSIVIFVVLFEVCVCQLPLPLSRPVDGNIRRTQDPSSSPSALPPKPSRRTDRDNIDHDAEETRYAPAEPYNFAYNVKDEFGNAQYRKEEGDGKGTVRGTFGYTDAKGLFRFVEYVADAFGYRANIRSNEPGISNAAAADTTLVAEETPRGIYEAAASDSKPLKAAREELPELVNRPVRVPKNVYAILGNKPSASGRVQYVVAAPVTTSSSTSAPDDISRDISRDNSS
ncbi:structural constituent of cuticle-like protein [Leptotrombidium deliense]|uniref:Structural constituent of cuticle-like protein n=1 Tax=Leptotrombidium deliense TaxID=299467 RepID=A0A443SM28_9ACAR|nr:structural constituent of cuticle-like protein [Leptotrombidium deliense]